MADADKSPELAELGRSAYEASEKEDAGDVDRATPQDEEDSVESQQVRLRAEKIEVKGQFTNIRRRLLVKLPNREPVYNEDLDELEEAYKNTKRVIGDCIALLGYDEKEVNKKKKLLGELEDIEELYCKAMDKAMEALAEPEEVPSTSASQFPIRSNMYGGNQLGGHCPQMDFGDISNPKCEGPLDRKPLDWLQSSGKSTVGVTASTATGTTTRTSRAVASAPTLFRTTASSTVISSSSVHHTTWTGINSSSSGSTQAGKYSTTTSYTSNRSGYMVSAASIQPPVSVSVHHNQYGNASYGQLQYGMGSSVRPTAQPLPTYGGTSAPVMSAPLPNRGYQPGPAGYFPGPVYPPYQPQYQPNAPSMSPAGPWSHLKKITIPVFEGDKKAFESWWAAYSTCIDAAPLPPETKMLQLRQYLKGEPLRAISSMGYSPTAYDAAKALLVRKYGGERRRVAIHLEAIENLKQIRADKPREIEEFAELLTVAVVNLKDANRASELGVGTLYYNLLKKLDERIIAKFHRWRYDHGKAESVEGLLEFCTLEAELLVMASETVFGFGSKTDQARPTRDSRPRTLATSSQPAAKCSACSGNHNVWQCLTFKAASPNERWSIVKSSKLCFRCLETGHSARDCTWGKTCGIDGCSKQHHRLLHGAKDKPSNSQAASTQPSKQQTTAATVSEPVAPDTPPSVSSTMTTVGNPLFAMRTVPILLRNNGAELRVHALLDDASTASYVSSHVASELGLSGEEQSLSVNVLSGRKEVFRTTPVTVDLCSEDGKTTATLDAYTTDRILGGSVVNWKNTKRNWPHLESIRFPAVGKKTQIDVLLGLNCAELHVSLKEVRGKPGEPIARLTPLGWTCVGPITASSDPITLLTFAGPQDVHESLAQLWAIEEFSKVKPQQPILTSEETEAVQETQQSLRMVDGRYEIGIPWRGGRPTTLPDNFPLAMKRLRNTEKRLRHDAAVAAAYSKLIHDYVTKDYVREVPAEELKPGHQWFLPHFAVLRPDKATTKTRIVFDASAKYAGVSLNDTMLPGPKLQRQLPSVLTRFRQKPVGIICDIAEMYLRVGLRQEDRPFHRFLWRDLNDAAPPRVYEFQRLVFGANASPFLAQFVTQEHARAHTLQFPLAAETMLSSTYMDDSMDSAMDDEEGVMMYEQLTECWAGAGMHARKWLSNSKVVMSRVPKEDRASQIDLDSPELPSIKTLGLLWSATTDTFTFKPTAPDLAKPITKRSFLSAMASVFDPLGFVSPFVVRARCLIQDMWLHGSDLDDNLPQDIESRVIEWYSDLAKLSHLMIPRCLQDTSTSSKLVNTQLHVFADASEAAYGAVGYLRGVYDNGQVSVTIIASRSRVTPLTSLSIPRLELMAAVTAVQLASWASDVLGMPIRDTALWTDSLNVLYWVQNRARSFKPFIATQIGKIQRETTPSQWRHVPSEKNPADVLSRGSSAGTLIKNMLWWSGPGFLVQEEREWPERRVPEPKSTSNLERKKNAPESPEEVATLTIVQDAMDEPWRLEPERFSSLTRLVRQHALVVRFLNNCRKPQELRETSQLSVEELESSRASIIAKAQEETLDEYQLLKQGKQIPTTSKLAKLRPMLNDNMLMCVDGRLRNAEFMNQESRCPVILPRGHWVTQLVVKDVHEKGHHVIGVSHTLSLLSERYWLLAGREEIKAWEKKCAYCKRQSAKPGVQLMAPLPTVRVSLPLRAFSRVAVDFAGPFTTKQGRGRSRLKRYLCLFTCLQSRAVHLEVATGLDVDAFMNAFVRMTSRRGLPIEVVSDNGTNFVGAAREMKEMVHSMEAEAMRRAAEKGVQWSFNPPAAPHHGGVHEALVKSAKRAIYAVLAGAEVSDEELETAVICAEGMLNSRPLSYQSADARDPLPLTLNHFLFGHQGQQSVPRGTDETTHSLRQRWRVVQTLVLQIWKRWMVEIVPLLNPRAKWRQEQPDLVVDDVVLVVDVGTPRGQWRLARVQETFPGKDGHVRVARVKVGDTSLVRPITRLCKISLE